MNQELPPIPELPHQQCPNCGHQVAYGVARCPNCGATLQSDSNNSGAGRTLRILGAIVMCLLALPLGAAGACFMLMFSTDGGISGSGLGGAAFGFGMVAVAGLLIWGAIRLAK